jgi:hypothetical protein
VEITRSGATFRAIRQCGICQRPSVPSDPLGRLDVLPGHQGQQRHRVGGLGVKFLDARRSQRLQT